MTSLPLPPIKSSSPAPPLIVSLPSAPSRRLVLPLPVRTLSSPLPVAAAFNVPVRVIFSILARLAIAKLTSTMERISSVPSFASSVIASWPKSAT
ncbi:MAG: hypothetical protein C0484_06995 [Rhodospirillum sp.]|nr:hypothetical protein [Rhodospirillum sp.]